jgi:hypothetical protein
MSEELASVNRPKSDSGKLLVGALAVAFGAAGAALRQRQRRAEVSPPVAGSVLAQRGRAVLTTDAVTTLAWLAKFAFNLPVPREESEYLQSLLLDAWNRAEAGHIATTLQVYAYASQCKATADAQPVRRRDIQRQAGWWLPQWQVDAPDSPYALWLQELNGRTCPRGPGSGDAVVRHAAQAGKAALRNQQQTARRFLHQPPGAAPIS